MSERVAEAWGSGRAYEQYVGRRSRKAAAEFVRWLALPPGLAWADVGCGTGALTSIILAACAPASVRGIDRSAAFVAQARQRITAPQARFETGDATHLPWEPRVCDVSVSGLVLNFVPDPDAMAREMVRVQRFPLCQPQPLQALFERVGLRSVAVRAIDIPTVFQDFYDYWQPFLGKTGAAPTYLASVGDDVRRAIRCRLESRLASTANGSIELTARAWAVQGVA